MSSPVGVAVLDTGIYNHIDLYGRIIDFYDCIHHYSNAYDDSGHGTHISGIIAGNGYASHGRFSGVAPFVNLVGVKVLDKKGNGRIEDVARGIDWISDNKDKYNIKVVNISFGMTKFVDGRNISGTCYNSSTRSDYLVECVERLWKQGITVVAAAGNSGPGKGSITSPGTSKMIITVGAYDVYYSGRGPTDDAVVKPDVVVSGRNIISCNNTRYGYTVKSGTSMATPFVTGAVASVLSHLDLTPNQIKQRLYNYTTRISIPEDQQGAGMLDIGAFVSVDNI